MKQTRTRIMVFALLILWLIMIWPGKGRKDRMAVFERQLIAHRGIHNNKGAAPENSMAAFRAAVEKGFGIELDIRLTADDQLVVAHDETLKRAAGIDRRVIDMTWQELKEVKLFKSEEHIPRFSEFLEMVGGRVPLIVELKCESRRTVERLCENAVFFLDSYDGPACIESFHPMVVRWFKKNRPEILRGQLSENFSGFKYPKGFGAFFLSCCAMNFLTKPDFIAYKWKHASYVRFRILRDLFHTETAGWTFRSEEDIQKAAGDFDILICEKFTCNLDDPHRKVPERPGRNMKHIIRRYVLVSGRVTAVGFRYRAVNIAHALGVSGWVRNTDDMRVEMEMQGTPEMLAEMMRRLGEQRYIEITGTEEREIPPVESEYEFKVRY